MRSQVSGLRQAERNTEDGISMIQTTEGYLTETNDILQRIRVLAIQASNGIYTPQDRQMIQVEVSQLVDEIDRIASQAEFNKMNLYKVTSLVVQELLLCGITWVQTCIKEKEYTLLL